MMRSEICSKMNIVNSWTMNADAEGGKSIGMVWTEWFFKRCHCTALHGLGQFHRHSQRKALTKLAIRVFQIVREANIHVAH
jgi:hypothetical protein